MTTTAGTDATLRAPGVRADRIGRWLMGLQAVATLFAIVGGVRLMSTAADDRLWIEGWRTTAYVVFAGLFLLLAVHPRAVGGVWELVFAQKLAVTIYAAVIGDVPEARLDGLTDFFLVLLTGTAYVLCRGWLGWRTARTGPAT